MGRSDATLNPGGVRIGTSEIYRQIDAIKEIEDSVAVEHSKDGDTNIILFVVLAGKYKLDQNLQEKIRYRLREQASPRHVPNKMIACPEIPYTKSGKISELAVKNALNQNELENLSALENPESLKFFIQYSKTLN